MGEDTKPCIHHRRIDPMPTHYAYARLENCIPVCFWNGWDMDPDPSAAIVYDSPPETLKGVEGVVILIFTGSLREALRGGKILQK
jgi:hypothetical protein